MTVIIQDTREKKPWDFTFHGFEQRITGLKTGDYSIEGLEDQLIIERKRSTGEISANLGFKRKQFEAEMKRMETAKHKFIICEFPHERILEFPKNSGIPAKLLSKIRMNAGYLSMSMNKISQEYGVEIIYCENVYEAEMKAIEIFNRILNEN
jgi:hypothetical protein